MNTPTPCRKNEMKPIFRVILPAVSLMRTGQWAHREPVTTNSQDLSRKTPMATLILADCWFRRFQSPCRHFWSNRLR